MTGSWWLEALIGVAAGLLVAWLVLLLVLVRVRPREGVLREAMRLLPDVLGLVRRLATDSSQPRGVRVRLWVLLGYLALPIDLVPDVIPVLGYADDAIVVLAILRSVVRRAGLHAVRGHWRGTPDGFDAVLRLTGMGPSDRDADLARPTREERH